MFSSPLGDIHVIVKRFEHGVDRGKALYKFHLYLYLYLLVIKWSNLVVKMYKLSKLPGATDG